MISNTAQHALAGRGLRLGQPDRQLDDALSSQADRPSCGVQATLYGGGTRSGRLTKSRQSTSQRWALCTFQIIGLMVLADKPYGCLSSRFDDALLP